MLRLTYKITVSLSNIIRELFHFKTEIYPNHYLFVRLSMQGFSYPAPTATSLSFHFAAIPTASPSCQRKMATLQRRSRRMKMRKKEICRRGRKRRGILSHSKNNCTQLETCFREMPPCWTLHQDLVVQSLAYQ